MMGSGSVKERETGEAMWTTVWISSEDCVSSVGGRSKMKVGNAFYGFVEGSALAHVGDFYDGELSSFSVVSQDILMALH